ncbi:glycosyltransferase family 4 protein [Algoriphagus limi]|uniref:Glycosyltransferase family 4 protein n=1 Tax=Algoriphagus limi TaxID=2975273 RepID=A0ABT2G1N2_9BACT|nr:glycosyltransferase family 4 protein [Algoriphagus limi]MCS5488982.1 glycosyltransferase family 4 protein [Algoriphagus limi]
MHICFLSQEFPRKGAIHGGIGSFLLTFSKSLVDKGHQVTVVGVSGNKFEDFIQEGVRVVNFPGSKARLIGWWRNFKKIDQFLDKLNLDSPIDIIEGSELTLAFLKRKKGIKYIIRLHGGHHFFAEGENRKIDNWKAYQEHKSFSKSDGFIAVSEYVKNHTAKYLSYHGKPVEIINYPVGLTKFYPADNELAIPFRLVFAGTVCEKKGIRQLIQALPIIAEEFPEIHLEVYGRDWLFPNGTSYIQFLKDTMPKEALDRVRFHGPVSHDDLPGYYEQAEICIFPSHMETQGLVAPEAMSMMKPVIFSKTGPGPETIVHGVDGWLCDPKSPEDIANTVLEAFHCRDKFLKIGKAARTKVFSKFDPEIITEKNLKFYQKILQIS